MRHRGPDLRVVQGPRLHLYSSGAVNQAGTASFRSPPLSQEDNEAVQWCGERSKTRLSSSPRSISVAGRGFRSSWSSWSCRRACGTLEVSRLKPREYDISAVHGTKRVSQQLAT